MADRTTRCLYCGLTLHQAETGRPRKFCNEFHRKWYVKATAAEIEELLAGREWTEVSDLQSDLRALAVSCRRLARRLEDVGEPVTHARIAAVAGELERTLLRHFDGHARSDDQSTMGVGG